MTTDEIDFGLGKILHNSLDLSREQRIEDLTEDLLQVEYESSGLVLDVGWYEPGEFMILIIKNGDWENPVFKKRTRMLVELRLHLDMAARIANAFETRWPENPS